MGEISLSELAVEKGLVGGPFGSDLVSRDYVEDGVPVIRGGNVHSKNVGGDFVYVTRRKYESVLLRNSAVPGDLVFTQRGTLGQVSIVPEEPYRAYVVSQSQMRLRPDPRVADGQYLFYACSTDRFKRVLLDNAIATGVPHINLGILARMRIPYFSLPEQRAIADVLGAIDDKIAANAKARRAAATLAHAVFSRAIVGAQRHSPLGELGKDGQVEFGDGYRTKKSEHADDGYAIVRAADVRDGAVTTNGTDHVSRAFSRQIGSKSVRVNDLVMTTKGTVGRTAIVGELTQDAVYSPQCCYFRVPASSEIQWGYLAGWFLSDLPQRQLDSLMHKSDMAPYVNLRDVGTLEIPRLPADQERDVGEEQQTLIALMQKCAASNRVLAHTRDELLPLLMSGKLTVKDAETAVADL